MGFIILAQPPTELTNYSKLICDWSDFKAFVTCANGENSDIFITFFSNVEDGIEKTQIIMYFEVTSTDIQEKSSEFNATLMYNLSQPVPIVDVIVKVHAKDVYNLVKSKLKNNCLCIEYKIDSSILSFNFFDSGHKMDPKQENHLRCTNITSFSIRNTMTNNIPKVKCTCVTNPVRHWLKNTASIKVDPLILQIDDNDFSVSGTNGNQFSKNIIPGISQIENRIKCNNDGFDSLRNNIKNDNVSKVVLVPRSSILSTLKVFIDDLSEIIITATPNNDSQNRLIQFETPLKRNNGILSVCIQGLE